MIKESDIVAKITEVLEGLLMSEFLVESERITGQNFGTPDDVIWDVIGNAEQANKLKRTE